MKKYLIIGNGVAGTTAAETIHRHDANGIIIMTKDLVHIKELAQTMRATHKAAK